jgi:hypothetical protein
MEIKKIKSKRWYYKLLFIIFLSVISYLIGNWMPIRYFIINVKDADIYSPDYLKIIIALVSAIVTFLAVIVALFKEDIRKLWEFSKIIVVIPDNDIVEKLNTDSDSSKIGEDVHLEAQKYQSRIEVNNNGNIPAIGAELYLEKLEYNSDGFANTQYIETLGMPLSWHGTDRYSIIIPPGGKKLIDIVELICPEKQSQPNGINTVIPQKLIIGNVENPTDFKKGKWKGTFGLYSQNAKPLRFQVIVEWSGKWEKRLAEMKKYLKIEIKNN